MAGWGEEPPVWHDKPAKGDPNPYAAVDPSRPWPLTGRGAEALRRLEAAERVAEADPDEPDDDLDLVAQAEVDAWDAEIDHLLAEARRERADVVPVVLPSSLSATAVARLRDDPDALRPRAGPADAAAAVAGGAVRHAGSTPGSRPGSASRRCSTPTSSPTAATPTSPTTPSSPSWSPLFERGEFADRAPFAVEAPFALVLAGQVVRGRIDAVYDDAPTAGTASSSSTGRPTAQQDADPLQLALYRLAWAELRGVPARAGARRLLLRARPAARRAARCSTGAELERIVVPRLEG